MVGYPKLGFYLGTHSTTKKYSIYVSSRFRSLIRWRQGMHGGLEGCKRRRWKIYALNVDNVLVQSCIEHFILGGDVFWGKNVDI